jgi:hypothetical protein
MTIDLKKELRNVMFWSFNRSLRVWDRVNKRRIKRKGNEIKATREIIQLLTVCYQCPTYSPQYMLFYRYY